MINVPFIELQQTESTNNYATALIHAGMAQHGTAVFAHEQTGGRGQRHKTWHTGKSENIAVSMILKPQGVMLSHAFRISMAIALAARNFFSRYAGPETKIKWPNDIYWCDRKAGGILIDNIVQSATWKYAVAGIGININQTEFVGLKNAVSLKQITAKSYNVVDAARELCADVQHYFETALTHPEKIFNEYHIHLYKKGQPVKLKAGTRVFEAVVKGVTHQGELMVQHTVEELFEVGTVEWMQESNEGAA